MTQNKKIAVTGGIGSGKSVFCSFLREMGYPVYSCDDVSDELWRESGYRKILGDAFPSCRGADGADKAKLSALVFSDPEAYTRLNAISHPRIMERLLKRMEGEGLAFAEVPLLYEGGYSHLFDGVIALRRAEDARIASVCARDALTEEEVRRRTEKQLDASALDGLGCLIVENNGDLGRLRALAREAVLRFI